jgi:integrase
LRQIRIHDLRHSHATIRLLRDHNIGDVPKQLGHSSIQITFDVYGHWVPATFNSEVDDLDAPRKANPLQNAENGCV